jgi:anti-sigma regulatory factor (Ser/Thr protein kinase)
MAAELTLKIQNNVAAIQTANETASRWMAERPTPADLQYFANLAIEELATNCIKYAYSDAKEHLIEVKLSVASNTLLMTVSDDGHPFNPLEAPAPDLALAPEDRPVGGLGLHLLRKMSDNMEYVRENGKNKLTLRRVSRSSL